MEYGWMVSIPDQSRWWYITFLLWVYTPLHSAFVNSTRKFGTILSFSLSLCLLYLSIVPSPCWLLHSRPPNLTLSSLTRFLDAHQLPLTWHISKNWYLLQKLVDIQTAYKYHQNYEIISFLISAKSASFSLPQNALRTFKTIKYLKSMFDLERSYCIF